MPKFLLGHEWFTIGRWSVESSICCVQKFFHFLPLFTLWYFFARNGNSMGLSALNVSSTVCEDSMCDLQSWVLPEDERQLYGRQKGHTMFSWFVTRILETHLRHILGQQRWAYCCWRIFCRHGVRISNVGKVGCWNICLNPCLLWRSPAKVMMQWVLEIANEGEMLRQSQLLRLSANLNLTMSQLYCPRDEVFTSKPYNWNFFEEAVEVCNVMYWWLKQSFFSPVRVNVMIIFCNDLVL